MSKEYSPYRPYKYAEIYSAGGDVSKPWYCYWFHQVPGSSPAKWKMFKKTSGMNRIKSAGARMTFAKGLQRTVNKLLDVGKTPFGEVRDTNTLKACIEKYLTDHVSNLKPRTKTTMKSGLMALCDYLPKGAVIYDVNKEKIIQALNDLQKKLHWSNRQRNNSLSRWRTFFNWLIGQDMILHNPTDKIAFLKVYPTDRNRPPTEEEFSRIVNHLYQHDKPLFLFAMIVYYQGFRVQETGKLQRSTIEFTTEHPFFRLAAKDQKDNEDVVTFISPHLLTFLYEAGIDKIPPSHYLFSSRLLPGAKEIKQMKHTVEEHWRKVVKLGLKIPVDLYSLKSKQATELARKSSTKDISNFLRHSSEEVTRKYIKKFKPVVPFSFYENQRELPLKKSK